MLTLGKEQTMTKLKYYLHTQAEDHIKIDIVWETSRTQDVSDYNILGVYLECKGKQMDGTSPVYDPYESGYWDEWLVDFGIKEDTHPKRHGSRLRLRQAAGQCRSQTG